MVFIAETLTDNIFYPGDLARYPMIRARARENIVVIKKANFKWVLHVPDPIITTASTPVSTSLRGWH